MRYIFYGTTCFMICIFFLQLILCVDARSAREDELKQGVRLAVKSTLSAMMEDRLESEEEIKAYFQSCLEELITSESELQVKFLEVQSKKGILSVQVLEKFQYPFGKTKTLEAAQTAVIDYAVQEE